MTPALVGVISALGIIACIIMFLGGYMESQKGQGAH